MDFLPRLVQTGVSRKHAVRCCLNGATVTRVLLEGDWGTDLAIQGEGMFFSLQVHV